MISFGKQEWRRTLTATIGAFLVSTTVIAATAAPVEAAQTCLLMPADIGAGPVVCSHA